MSIAREMFRFDQFIQGEEIDVNIPKSSAVRDMAFFEKEEKVVLQGYESIKRHYKEHLESEMRFVIDDVVDQLKTNDIALIDWVYLEHYLCPSNEKLKSDDRDKIFDDFISGLLKKSDFKKVLLFSENAKIKYLSERQFKYQESSHMLFVAPKNAARKIAFKDFTNEILSPDLWPAYSLLIIFSIMQITFVVLTFKH